eukprot:GHVL01044954.1.p1 GENE.GHVL01044954.1~~GHVL01044954.1.p1  ORF type:complete len:378 (-),score=71.99 GHVL01044954.1:1298-2431(-)
MAPTNSLDIDTDELKRIQQERIDRELMPPPPPFLGLDQSKIEMIADEDKIEDEFSSFMSEIDLIQASPAKVVSEFEYCWKPSSAKPTNNGAVYQEKIRELLGDVAMIVNECQKSVSENTSNLPFKRTSPNKRKLEADEVEEMFANLTAKVSGIPDDGKSRDVKIKLSSSLLTRRDDWIAGQLQDKYFITKMQQTSNKVQSVLDDSGSTVMDVISDVPCTSTAFPQESGVYSNLVIQDAGSTSSDSFERSSRLVSMDDLPPLPDNEYPHVPVDCHRQEKNTSMSITSNRTQESSNNEDMLRMQYKGGSRVVGRTTKKAGKLMAKWQSVAEEEEEENGQDEEVISWMDKQQQSGQTNPNLVPVASDWRERFRNKSGIKS